MAYHGTLTDPLYRPAVINILAITNAFPAVVTTTYDGLVPAANEYINGLIVRLIVPQYYGMVLANNLKGSIRVLTASTFEIDIDTRYFDAFAIPSIRPGRSYFDLTAAQVVPVGEDTDILRGSFTNVFQQP